MQICRLYIQSALETGQKIIIPIEQRHYLRHVMRLQNGDPVILFNGERGEYEARIHYHGKSETVCHINTFNLADCELPCEINIIQAACSNEKIEHIIQKGTELGAASFQIVCTERSALKLAGHKLDTRLKRWQKIIIEAAEQSGRTRIPTLHWHHSLEDIHLAETSYAMHPSATQSWMQRKDHLAQADEVAFVVGPEGGLSAADLNTLAETGCNTLSFGSLIMRTETAAPALLAAMQAIRHD